MLPLCAELMGRELGEVGAGLGIVGRNLQGMLKVFSRVVGFSGAGFEDTEIIPAVGILGREAQGGALLGNGFLQAAGGSQDLGEQGVRLGIVWRDVFCFTQLMHRVVGACGLRESHGEPLARVEIAGILTGSNGERIDGVLGPP